MDNEQTCLVAGAAVVVVVVVVVVVKELEEGGREGGREGRKDAWMHAQAPIAHKAPPHCRNY